MNKLKKLRVSMQFFAGNSRLQEIEHRLSAIRSEMSADGADLDALNTEVDGLLEERKGLVDTAEKRRQLLGRISIGQEGQVTRTFDSGENGEGTEKRITADSPEYRSAFLHRLQGRELTEQEKRTISSASNSAGALIPTQTLNVIVDKLRQVTALFPHISVYHIPSNLSIPTVNSKNAASWVAEKSDSSDVDDSFDSITLTAYMLIRTIQISAQVETMAIDAFEAFISSEMAKQLSVAIENAILNGSGTNQPKGILKAVKWDSSNTITVLVDKTLEYDNICDALALLPSMYHNNAKIVTNRKTLYNSIAKIKGTDGKPIFISNTEDGFAGKVMGFPVIIDDYMVDDEILIGDLSYYVMNFSKDFEITSDTSAGYRSGSTVYRGMALVDGNVTQSEGFVKIKKASA